MVFILELGGGVVFPYGGPLSKKIFRERHSPVKLLSGMENKIPCVLSQPPNNFLRSGTLNRYIDRDIVQQRPAF